MPLVVVSGPDPGWPQAFSDEAARLRPVLASWLTGEIHHIGSTAVPGLAAKPIQDMLAVVGDLGTAGTAVGPLAGAGYQHAPHRPDALWFFREQASVRTHQLHLASVSSPLVNERLVFRDALREDPDLLAAYAHLKRLQRQDLYGLAG